MAFYFFSYPVRTGTHDFIQLAGLKDAAKKIGPPVKEIVCVAEELETNGETETAWKLTPCGNNEGGPVFNAPVLNQTGILPSYVRSTIDLGVNRPILGKQPFPTWPSMEDRHEESDFCFHCNFFLFPRIIRLCNRHQVFP
jgi:hypothetical protein